MCRLVETIKILNRKICHLEYHQARLNRSRERFYKGLDGIDLSRELEIPDKIGNGIYKLRVIYGHKIERIEWKFYQKRKITSLKIISNDEIEYSDKFLDRKDLSELMNQKEDCDDILIVKNGFITDTSYSNIVFYDGCNWITPKYPLLRGTCRERLINEGIVKERNICVSDFSGFEKCSLINAMMDLGELEIPIRQII